MAIVRLEDGTLAELPDDLLYERPDVAARDLYRPADFVGAVDVKPSDYPGLSGQNVPKFATLVQSIWDTRPINGQDFLVGDRQNIVDSLCFGSIPAQLFSYEVPRGYLAVVRQVSFVNVIGIPPTSLGDGVIGRMQMTVLVNNNAQLGYNTVQLPGIDGEYSMHVLADEGQIVIVRLGCTDLSGTGLTATITGVLYGNLLLKRGFPTNFEVGSLPL